MTDTLDSLVIRDWERSMGFSSEDPLTVSMEGIEVPTDDSVGRYVENLEQYGTEALKGAVGAYMPGEIERFAKAGIKLAFPDVGEDRIESAWNALSEDPEAFSAEDFYQWFGETQGDLGPDAIEGARMTGEVFGLGGLLKKGLGMLRKSAKPATMAAGVAGSAMTPVAEAAQQPTGQYRDTFVNYLMENENAAFASGRAKTARHKSPEGGRDTVGFGHKLTAKEEKEGKIYGIPIKDIDVDKAKEILLKDIERAETQAKKNLKSMHPNVDFDLLSEDKKEMLTDIQFNVKDGGIKAFPNFVRGVVTDDVGLMKKEYKRYYTTAKGAKREVKKRNTDFFNIYLKNL